MPENRRFGQLLFDGFISKSTPEIHENVAFGGINPFVSPGTDIS